MWPWQYHYSVASTVVLGGCGRCIPHGNARADLLDVPGVGTGGSRLFNALNTSRLLAFGSMRIARQKSFPISYSNKSREEQTERACDSKQEIKKCSLII